MLNHIRSVLKETYEICYVLFKIMIPVIIAVKLLSELGVIDVLSGLLAPAMQVVGLPGELGLAWATALVTNIYGGIIVFVALARDMDITAAQATIFASMVLIAHSMPVELQVMRKSGPRLRVMLILRLGSALLYGWLLHLIYTATNTLQHPVQIVWTPEPRAEGLLAWVFAQVTNLAYIAFIILCLVVFMRILSKLGIIDLMNRLLSPLLKVFGVSARASTLTIFGLTLGLSYAGGMIIKEARSGKLSETDVFFSVSLLGIMHSLIEDTLLLMVIGGELSGILWMRIPFSLLVIFLITKAVSRMDKETFHRYIFSPAPETVQM
ncbi:nucleoside recognition domain-containing protein [Limisalsivibrio acetivorans]|uniref:nucleoside recognition domain-containing protein n=1 Tax=Limisalsivibrio acetivorans TaxID=1304888 RepID=UPI0003B4A582|nr:nucleoside recognition domain-containing protein [Limisalsivibrio acetivorans]